MSALSKWTADLLLERVIQALAISDVSELEQLVQIAEEIRAQGVELAFNESGMRLLSGILSETSRNLRLLRRVCRSTGNPALHVAQKTL